MQVEQTTNPTTALLTVERIRSFLQIGFSGDDSLLQTLIPAATGRIESLTGLVMLERNFRITIDQWPAEVHSRGHFRFPLGPVTGVTVTVDGDAVTDQFTIRTGVAAILRPRTGIWPSVTSGYDGVQMEVVAGFGASSADVPEELRTATELTVLQIYRERNNEKTSDITARIGELISGWRRRQL